MNDVDKVRYSRCFKDGLFEMKGHDILLTTDVLTQLDLICDSYQKWTGKDLRVNHQDSVDRYEEILKSNIALVSHGVENDPIFNFGNRIALDLFEMTWERFTLLPSKMSAEIGCRMERAKLLQRVNENGYINDYQGVRISSSGKRFLIQNAEVWNIVDAAGFYCGQAARFGEWEYL